MFYKISEVKKNFIEADGDVYFLSEEYTPSIYIEQKINSIASKTLRIYAGQWFIVEGKRIEKMIDEFNTFFEKTGIKFSLDHTHIPGVKEDNDLSDIITLSWYCDNKVNTKSFIIYYRLV